MHRYLFSVTAFLAACGGATPPPRATTPTPPRVVTQPRELPLPLRSFVSQRLLREPSIRPLSNGNIAFSWYDEVAVTNADFVVLSRIELPEMTTGYAAVDPQGRYVVSSGGSVGFASGEVRESRGQERRFLGADRDAIRCVYSPRPEDARTVVVEHCADGTELVRLAVPPQRDEGEEQADDGDRSSADEDDERARRAPWISSVTLDATTIAVVVTTEHTRLCTFALPSGALHGCVASDERYAFMGVELQGENVCYATSSGPSECRASTSLVLAPETPRLDDEPETIDPPARLTQDPFYDSRFVTVDRGLVIRSCEPHASVALGPTGVTPVVATVSSTDGDSCMFGDPPAGEQTAEPLQEDEEDEEDAEGTSEDVVARLSARLHVSDSRGWATREVPGGRLAALRDRQRIRVFDTDGSEISPAVRLPRGLVPTRCTYFHFLTAADVVVYGGDGCIPTRILFRQGRAEVLDRGPLYVPESAGTGHHAIYVGGRVHILDIATGATTFSFAPDATAGGASVVEVDSEGRRGMLYLNDARLWFEVPSGATGAAESTEAVRTRLLASDGDGRRNFLGAGTTMRCTEGGDLEALRVFRDQAPVRAPSRVCARDANHSERGSVEYFANERFAVVFTTRFATLMRLDDGATLELAYASTPTGFSVLLLEGENVIAVHSEGAGAYVVRDASTGEAIDLPPSRDRFAVAIRAFFAET